MVNDQQKSCLLGYPRQTETLYTFQPQPQSWWKIRHSVVLKNRHHAEERRVDGLNV